MGSLRKRVEVLDRILPGTKRWLRPAGTWEKAGRKLGTSDTTYIFFKEIFKLVRKHIGAIKRLYKQ